MTTNDENAMIGLLRERADKLESSYRYYDAVLNTPLADTLRKRNSELESALWAVVQRGNLPAAELDELKVILGNKSTTKY
ncbi:MAG: hypothetical protein WKG03_08865 [Telluria sp.]